MYLKYLKFHIKLWQSSIKQQKCKLMLVVEAEDLMYGDLYQKKDPTINKTIGRITHDLWNLEIIY